ncbi:MAG TPA: DUF58 domain-containing protein [Candidatus Limnocylindrales bacterium]|nr:DUF58 domain-containing protein [Candidatus Limnocylindrales bacterium]
MILQAIAAIGLILFGSFLDVPIAAVLGVIALLLAAVQGIWARDGLRGVSYRRRLATDRTTWGEEIPLEIEVWNHKRLPLAWLRADDDAEHGVAVRGRSLVDTEWGRGALRNAWTLAPFERVIRQFHIGANRRGVFELGPVELTVGDLFARRAATELRPLRQRFIVRPRTVGAPALERPERLGADARARRGLTEDPARFAGVRPYSPGDPLRRIHARTSARVGQPMTKRFEPSREREVLIALDVQTTDGPAWDVGFDPEDVEELYVVAASLARSLAGERAAFGIAAAGYTGAETTVAHVPISAAPGQTERVLDLLARLSSHASAPFERLLIVVQRIARPGTTVLVLTARDPSRFVGRLRKIEQGGCRVIIATCGSHAARDAAVARSAGFLSWSARLDGPWRTAARLVVSR